MMDKGHVAIFLATSGHSGVERVMGNLVKGMATLGLRVDLLRIRGHGPFVSGLPQNVNLIELPTSHVNSSLPLLVRYLKDQRPDALLTDKDRVNRVAILANLLSGARVRHAVRIGTTVSPNLRRRSFTSRKSQLLSIRMLYPLANRVLVPSYGAKQDLEAIAPRLRGKVQVVASPIVDDKLYEMAALEPDHPWLNPKRVPTIVGVGELCERKDFATLVRAFALVRDKLDSRLIILGKGRKAGQLKMLAKELNVDGDVDLPGFVKNPISYMARADCFCLTSRCEGMPVVLIEALALGTPVCSTDCPSGPREVLKGGKVGRLVDIGDHRALSRALMDVIKDPPPRCELKRAVEKYSVKRGTEEYVRQLLPTKGRGAIQASI